MARFSLGRHWRNLMLLLSGLVLSAGLAACNGSSGTLPDFAYRDFVLGLTNFDPHVGQLLQFRVVDGAGRMRSLAIVDPLPLATEGFRLPGLLVNSGYHLDFFADMSGNRSYDAPPTDHAWRLDIPDNGVLNFAHNVSFTDIATPAVTPLGQDCTINFSGFTTHIGDMLMLRVRNTLQQTVGLYHLGAVPADSFSLALPGISESGGQYTIEYWVDANGNMAYDAPPTDPAWRAQAAAAAAGLTVNIANSLNYTDIVW